MNDSEKNAWLLVLLFMWGMPLVAFATSALMPGPNAALGARGFAWFLIASTVAYLLREWLRNRADRIEQNSEGNET